MPLMSGADLPRAAEARLAALEEAVVRLGQLVEHIYSSPHLGLSVPPAPGLNATVGGPTSDPQVLELIRNRDLIGAIKRYRELTGVGLSETKAAVDALVRTPEFATLYPSARS